MPCAAIIVASGKSRRMGFDKLAAELNGTSVLRRSVDAFMACDAIDRIVVVAPEKRYYKLLDGDFPKPICRVDGGAKRQDSVMAGLAELTDNDHFVAVHDGARPLVQPDAIKQCIEAARQYGAASLARPITDTIKKASKDGFCRQGIDRSMLWLMETPQVFRSSVLKRAYENVTERELTVTDEVSTVEAMGVATKIIPSEFPNLKVTHPADIPLAEFLSR